MFHGIVMTDLQSWEITAAREAMLLLGGKQDEVWGEVKRDSTGAQRKAWRVLARAANYLNDIVAMGSGKRPRTFNRDKAYPVKKDDDGKRLCRWCQKPVPGPRRSYCGKECLKEVDIRTNAGSLRAYVKQRDKGVCAVCKGDTEKLKRVLHHAARAFYELLHGIGSTNGFWSQYDFSRESASLLKRMGFDRNISFWQADHVVELVNGGESTMENVQTLCVPCHKGKTRQMHGDRARARRTLSQPSLLN